MRNICVVYGIYSQMNPQHTIPMLDDNGVIVIDSHVICGYLCEKYGEQDNNLYPKDLEKRARCDARLHFDSSHLFARLRFLIEPILFMKSAEWPDDRIQLIETAWDILERMLGNGAYVCGDEMTIADFCLIATTSSMSENVPLDAEKHAKILEWIDRMAQLPYYEEINGEPSKTFQAIIRGLKEQNAADAGDADADGTAEAGETGETGDAEEEGDADETGAAGETADAEE